MSRLRRSAAAGALAVAVIGSAEGYRSKAYRDSIGVPTICFGETKGVHIGDVKTRAECESMFVTRLDGFANAVERCVRRPMSAKTEVAFVSLAYNIGEGAFCRSSVVHLYNEGHSREACDAMLHFNRAGGRVLAGLTSRRRHERQLCLEDL
jgi:lysozyme